MRFKVQENESTNWCTACILKNPISILFCNQEFSNFVADCDQKWTQYTKNLGVRFPEEDFSLEIWKKTAYTNLIKCYYLIGG